MPSLPIPFIVDECLPADLFSQQLVPRGHTVISLAIKTKDPSILEHAEATGSVVVTADRWFYDQLRKANTNPRRKYRRAGVILVPGSMGKPVVTLLMNQVDFIEAQYTAAQLKADQRVVVWLQATQTVFDH
jgi:predicted nuclease of predicted toxin-antitoxin system